MCNTDANNISLSTRNEELEGVPLLPVEHSQLMWSSLSLLPEHKSMWKGIALKTATTALYSHWALAVTVHNNE